MDVETATQTDALNASLIARDDINATLSIVRVRPDTGRVPDFKPGQFVRLGLPKPDQSLPAPGKPARVRFTRRAYSIASSPLVTDALEFFVVRIDEGALTPRLWEIPVGGRLWMEGEAKGEFMIELAPQGLDLVMVSTGTGIAPFLSMLRTFRHERRWRRFVLINGTRYASDLGYGDELAAICREDPTVRYIPLVTREPEGSGYTGLRGRVQSVLEPDTYQRLVGAALDPAQCHVFLCGNPEMIDAVEALLHARGFVTDTHKEKGNIHFERYW